VLDLKILHSSSFWPRQTYNMTTYRIRSFFCWGWWMGPMEMESNHSATFRSFDWASNGRRRFNRSDWDGFSRILLMTDMVLSKWSLFILFPDGFIGLISLLFCLPFGSYPVYQSRPGIHAENICLESLLFVNLLVPCWQPVWMELKLFYRNKIDLVENVVMGHAKVWST